MRNKKGFTLIELLVVIAIIGLLATLAVVSLRGAQRSARDTKRIADIKQVQTATELFYSEAATYPTPASWALFIADGGDDGIGAYITQVPVDPQNGNGETGADLGAAAVPTDDHYVYTYMFLDNGLEYVLSTKLEQADHAALGQDDDEDYGPDLAPWLGVAKTMINSFSTGVGTGAALLDCDDANEIYCLGE